MANGWNFADIWEHVADRFPHAPCQVGHGRQLSWSEVDHRADAVAAALLASGTGHQSKVAHYLYNCPEFLESMFAMFKVSLVPVNTNYRYGHDELVYLWENADVEAVVFHGSLADRIEPIHHELPAIALWLWVDDGSGPCPSWAMPYEDAARTPVERVRPPWGRSGDDLYLLYTGGTTGMPKGVMWRQRDIVGAVDGPTRQPLPTEVDWDAFDAKVAKPGPVNLPAAPLMHGTGAFNAMSNLLVGGSVVTLEGRHFDATELLDTIEREHVNSISIVGDAFAKPILRALDAEPERWDISRLRVIVSSGVMWSSETKAGLLGHNARLIMVDALGSSEAIGMASSTTTADSAASTATFRLGPFAKVLTEDGRDVVPGSGERGRVAMRGYMPVGYYKDAEKSAATFQLVGDTTWSIPGDWAEVELDGTVRLLGRGSQCINTGGEKVYPEEVEEVLKRHPSVADAAVVGLPDERFGEAITALVEARLGHDIDQTELVAHVKAHLSAFKAPKRVIAIATIGRAPNGKVDYKRLKQHALDVLGAT